MPEILRLLLVCAIVFFGSVHSSLANARCTEAREDYRFIQIERDGRLEERRLSLTSHAFELRPGYHEHPTYVGCLECPPKVGVGVVWLAAAGDRFVAADAGPRPFLQRYWPQGLGFTPQDEVVGPTGSSRDLNVGALRGSAVEYQQSTSGSPIERFVLFSMKDECVAVAGVILSYYDQGAVSFETIAGMLAQLRIENVEPGSTYRSDRGPDAPPLVSPRAPLERWSPERLELGDIRRALSTER